MNVIYIAGPYRAKTAWGLAENIRHAERIAAKLWREGWAVVCPHKNSAYLNGVAPDNSFLEGGLEILRRCDAIFMLTDWELSRGALAEYQVAKQLGLAIYYEDKRNSI